MDDYKKWMTLGKTYEPLNTPKYKALEAMGF